MTTMHLGTCHQNSRALTCFMSLATVTLAQNKAAEVKATLAQNQAKIRSCQQQARRQAKSLLQGGLSCAAVRRSCSICCIRMGFGFGSAGSTAAILFGYI